LKPNETVSEKTTPKPVTKQRQKPATSEGGGNNKQHTKTDTKTKKTKKTTKKTKNTQKKEP